MTTGTDTDSRPHCSVACRIRRPAILLAPLLLLPPLLLPSSCLAATHRHHPVRRGWDDGVVRCVAAAAPSHRHVAVARNRGTLPTDRAVFFARSGDRCFWHHRSLGRG